MLLCVKRHIVIAYMDIAAVGKLLSSFYVVAELHSEIIGYTLLQLIGEHGCGDLDPSCSVPCHKISR